jgi:hypothetical protein
MSCTIVAKQQWYGQLKLKPSYTIVCYYVFSYFIYYGGPPMASNAVLAIIANGGPGIFVIYREGVEINYFLLYFIDSTKTLRRRPHPTPCKEAPKGAVF